MKRIFLFAIILIYNQSFSQWISQSSNTNTTLNSIFFINKTTGWACGLEVVLKTTDCGITWSNTYLAGNHKSIIFTDINTGFICGENGKIFITTDGGSNWVNVNSGTITRLNQITFLNSNFGIIAGSKRTILRTTNAGMNWQSVMNSNSSLDFHDVKIINNNKVLVSGTESTIYKSNDAGVTWDSSSFKMPNPLLTIEFMNENTGWVSGCCGMFMKTTNAGTDWSPELYLTPGYTIHSLKFANENLGWAIGAAGYILRTTNGGNNWDSLYSGTHTDLYSAYIINKDTGFIAGYNGLILKTINGGGEGYTLGVEQAETIKPESYFLSQNYPNPFNPSTTINFSIPFNVKSEMSTSQGGSNVKLIIYSVLGNEVATLVNERKNAGSYNIEFNGSNFSSGVYFYSLLVNGNITDTKRMILLK